MARTDVYLYIDASDPAEAVVTSQTVTTAATFPTLILGDTPTFSFYFTDGTVTWPSWAGNASYSLTAALSDAIAGDEPPLALQTSATPITGGWSMVLPVNTGALVDDLQRRKVSQAWPVVQLWLHLRVADASGYVVSYAMIRVNVRLRAIADTQTTPDDPLPAGTQYVLADESGALSSPSNFLSVSGLVTQTGSQTITGQKTFVAPILGTPASGTVTNLTGTASININGTVGATTPSTGAFTTLSATGLLSTAFSLGATYGATVQDTGDTSSAAFVGFRKGNGTAIGGIFRVTTTDAVSYNTTSDARLKTNVRDFSAEDAGRIIDGLRPRWFDWKASDLEQSVQEIFETGEMDKAGEPITEIRQKLEKVTDVARVAQHLLNNQSIIGFIAQEEAAVDPALVRCGAVTVGDDDPANIAQQWQRSDAALVPILVAELKALRARVAALEKL